MKIPRAQLAAVIGEKTLKQTDLKRLTQAVAAYLMEQKSIDELESLMRDVLAYRQARGIIEADVVSAHDLSQEAMNGIEGLVRHHYPDAKHIVMHEDHDAELVGGFQVNMAHEQLDMSIRAKLDTFKHLTEGIN